MPKPKPVTPAVPPFKARDRVQFTANSRTSPPRPVTHRGTVRRLDLTDPARPKAAVYADGTVWSVPLKMLEKL